MASRRRKSNYRRKKRRTSKKKSYRRRHGRRYANAPFPRVKRVCLWVVDKVNVAAAEGAGEPQELVYVCNGLFDTDTQTGDQSAAYFETIMQYYKTYTVEKSEIAIKWTCAQAIGGNTVAADCVIMESPAPEVFATSTNEYVLLGNQGTHRSSVKTMANWANTVHQKLRYNHKRSMPYSGFYESFGGRTTNAEVPWYWHCVRWPSLDSQTLDQVTALVKIKYYVTFSNPDPTAFIYNVD